MKNYYITEEQMNQMLNLLGEAPGKYSATPINMILYIQQNQPVQEDSQSNCMVSGNIEINANNLKLD
jgi:hypothetical protein